MALTYRELLPEEFDKIKDGVENWDKLAPINSRIFGSFDDDRLVAYWAVIVQVSLEGLWIDPQYRKSSTILRRMTEQAKGILKSMGIKSVYATVMDGNTVMRRFVKWFGATPVGGTLYKWDVPEE